MVMSRKIADTEHQPEAPVWKDLCFIWLNGQHSLLTLRNLVQLRLTPVIYAGGIWLRPLASLWLFIVLWSFPFHVCKCS